MESAKEWSEMAGGRKEDGGGAEDSSAKERLAESHSKEKEEEEEEEEEEAEEEVDEEANRPTVDRDHKFPPRVAAEREVVAEGVVKQLIREGRGDNTPPKHATCFLHYRTWAASTLHKFEDTWEEGAPAEILLGHEKLVLRGLACGVATMKAGEHALFHVGWKLAYGEEGNFSFPNVPPKADVIYEVEFIGFEEAPEGRARSEMTVEERIAAADRRRVDGNDFFKDEKLQDAIQQYEMALAYMGDDFMFQLFGKFKEMADAVKIPCHLNMAASLLKLDKYDEAIGQCTVVLAEDKNNTKALFRRGKARSALGQTDAAKVDFEKVKDLVPGDKAVLRELRKIAEAERELYLKQKELYQGLFAKDRTAPPPRPDRWYTLVYQWLVALFRSCLRPLRVHSRVKSD